MGVRFPKRLVSEQEEELKKAYEVLERTQLAAPLDNMHLIVLFSAGEKDFTQQFN